MTGRRFACLLLAVCLCALCAGAVAEPLTYCGITVDSQDTVVDFGSVKVTDVPALVEMIEQMPNLTQVDMYESRLSKSDMDMLFDGYPQIRFGWTLHISEHTVRTDATAFSTLHGPKSIPHESKEFEVLRFCRDLQAIDLGHNWVTDLEFLRNFPHLKVLILAPDQITDLTVIGELTELEYLELFTNHITDVTPLANLTHLKDLNLAYNSIEDLTPLHALTQLERLWGYHNKKLSQEQIDAMEAAVPDCEYDWVNNPTAGTWRTHPRYFVIREIFQSGVYRPFDDEAVQQEEAK